MEIKFIIDDAKIDKIIEAMKNLYPIPLDDENNPKFTDNAWTKEVVRQWIINQVARYEQIKQQKAIKFETDDSLVK